MTRRRPPLEATTAAAAAAKRCAIYTRKSTAVGSDVSLSSLEAQRDVGLAYVVARRTEGWRVLPDRYDDGGYTGANLERPAFRRLLADIAAGKIDIVVVYKVDRLSRSLLDFAQVMGVLDRHNVAFVSVTQNFSTADAIGRLTLNLLISFAEFEREMIAERTRDKIAASRRRGQWTGGIVPFGYRSVARRLQIDPETGTIARQVFTTYLAGRSVVAVLRLLDEAAPRVKRNGQPRPWVRNDVRRILDSPIYAGLIRVGDELVRGEHEALIDRATFEQVHQRRQAAGQTVRSGDDPFFLRGLVRCGVCGGPLVGAETRRARRSFRYYRCHTRDRRGAGACVLKPVRADDLEGLVLAQLRERAGDSALGPAVFAQAGAQLAARIDALAAERARLPVELAAATARADDQAGRMEHTDAHGRAELEPVLTTALAEAARIDRRLIAVDGELQRLRAVTLDQDWVAATLAHFEPVWAALAPAERVRLVGHLVAGVVIDGDRGVQLRWQPWLEESVPA